MIDGNLFTQVALEILHPHSPLRRQAFYCSHGLYVSRVIDSSQMTSSNLVIAWYYLYKYSRNSILAMEAEPEEDTMTIYLLLVSLILSNKLYDDQSFTLRTWLALIEGSSPSSKLRPSLKSLDAIERHFIAALDYCVSFRGMNDDVLFWDVIPAYNVCFDYHLPSPPPAATVLATACAALPIPTPPPVYTYSTKFYSPPIVNRSLDTSMPLTPMTPLFAYHPHSMGTPLTPMEIGNLKVLHHQNYFHHHHHRRTRLHMPRVSKPVHLNKSVISQWPPQMGSSLNAL